MYINIARLSEKFDDLFMIHVGVYNADHEGMTFFRRVLPREKYLVQRCEALPDESCVFDIPHILLYDRFGLSMIDHLELKDWLGSLNVPTIVIGKKENAQREIGQCMKIGAADYLTRPIRGAELASRIQKVYLQKLAQVQYFSHLQAWHHDASGNYGAACSEPPVVSGHDGSEWNRPGKVCGSMSEVWSAVERYADLVQPVVINGESGTGKDRVARALHEKSQRKQRRFYPVNCGAIPATLVESELFGVAKGAYTGACARRGAFISADGGTLFLDEIAEIDASAQASLLRVIESGRVRPVGSDEHIPVDVRLVAATNRDLGDLVRQKKFRADLYYRLMVFQITIPPLRQRKDEIPDLIVAIQQEFFPDIAARISASAMNKLMEHDWPGNIRELRNTIQRALVDCEYGTVLPHHIRFFG